MTPDEAQDRVRKLTEADQQGTLTASDVAALATLCLLAQQATNKQWVHIAAAESTIEWHTMLIAALAVLVAGLTVALVVVR
jgi:acyl CoA:acetate/3-ketoacid CoA transferase